MQNDIWKRIILKEPTPIFLASNGDETGDTKKKTTGVRGDYRQRVERRPDETAKATAGTKPRQIIKVDSTIEEEKES